MAIKCGVCFTREATYVCHHCGKPLCSNEGCVVAIEDTDFAPTRDGTLPTTYSCPACHKERQTPASGLLKRLPIRIRESKE